MTDLPDDRSFWVVPNRFLAGNYPITPSAASSAISAADMPSQLAATDAFGGYRERVESPGDLKEAFKRGIAATENGQAALIEVITSKEIDYSIHR